MMVCYTNQQEIPILPQAPAETENTRRASVSKKDGTRRGGTAGRKPKGTNGAVKSDGIVFLNLFATFDSVEGFKFSSLLIVPVNH